MNHFKNIILKEKVMNHFKNIILKEKVMSQFENIISKEKVMSQFENKYREEKVISQFKKSLEERMGYLFKIFFLLMVTSLFFSFAKNEPRQTNQQNQITIEMKGLVCSFCAAKVRRGLKKVSFIENKGKKNIFVDVEKQVSIFKKRKGKKIDFKELKKVINEAGYQILKIHFYTKGKVHEKKHFMVKDSKQVLSLNKKYKVEKLKNNPQNLSLLEMNDEGEVFFIKK